MSSYYCPTCSQEMDIETALWLVDAKFYCSERCARMARGLNPVRGSSVW